MSSLVYSGTVFKGELLATDGTWILTEDKVDSVFAVTATTTTRIPVLGSSEGGNCTSAAPSSLGVAEADSALAV
tara:strand:+ start:29 stop:250 length:222 start_codon:yes stop_codon:yes gene_type:complete